MEFIKEEIEDMSDPEPSRIKHEDTEKRTDTEVKDEIDDMSDPEPSRIKHEDTEEQTDWIEVKQQRLMNESKKTTSRREGNPVLKSDTYYDLVLWVSVSDNDHSSHLQFTLPQQFAYKYW
ncbi:hypothetical protein QQF64_008100 [Cirrhinus molitorella]|uniref:Uncharacterized protein n=1 Tax=Cirrhinus molitorella TaxID=172907 RepID=A0ABR3M569_9TELE